MINIGKIEKIKIILTFLTFTNIELIHFKTINILYYNKILNHRLILNNIINIDI